MKSFLFLIPLVQAGEIVWDGFFNSSFTVDQLDKCMTDTKMYLHHKTLMYN